MPPCGLSELVELVTQDDEQPIFEDSTISDIGAETTYGIISQKTSGNDSWLVPSLFLETQPIMFQAKKTVQK